VYDKVDFLTLVWAGGVKEVVGGDCLTASWSDADGLIRIKTCRFASKRLFIISE